MYYGLLIAQRQQLQIQSTIDLTQVKLYDVESALLAGKTDPVNKVELLADLANQQQQLFQVSNQIEDYTADLNELLGTPSGTALSEESLPKSTTGPVPVADCRSGSPVPPGRVETKK